MKLRNGDHFSTESCTGLGRLVETMVGIIEQRLKGEMRVKG